MRYFIELAYHGKNYHGWQVQPDALSVQEVLEDRLGKLLGSPTAVVAAGRTDAGVHARQMFVHFDVHKPLEESDLCHRLNAFLPPDIGVKQIFPVRENAHARFDALSRSYLYRISLSKDPFEEDRSWLLYREPDIEIMNNACRELLGKKDFSCFSRSHTDVKTYYCDVREARWVKSGQLLLFSITADRFLRNMVRAVVGTVLEVGQGKMTVSEFKEVLNSKDRAQAGASAPAKGLFLTAVVYPESIRL